MSISIHTISTSIEILVCTSIEDIRAAMSEDAELQILQEHIIRGCPQNKDQLEPSLGQYWPIKYNLVMTYGVAMKGKQIIIPLYFRSRYWTSCTATT